MKMLVGIIAIGLFSTSVNAMQPSKYYDMLRMTECPKKVNEACCRASVTAMQKLHARPVKSGQECQKDYIKRSIRCPSSLNWCEYRPDWERGKLFSPGK